MRVLTDSVQCVHICGHPVGPLPYMTTESNIHGRVLFHSRVLTCSCVHPALAPPARPHGNPSSVSW